MCFLIISSYHLTSGSSAEEWKKWALIYAPAVLYRLLTAAAHAHFMHFVLGISLLLSKVTDAGLNQGKMDQLY